uniref:Uncharacterized protein n=1 Tax=Glossina palpalis gambiensis TaxID=67801 RepID=A0A1B0BRD4_9MUSC
MDEYAKITKKTPLWLLPDDGKMCEHNNNRKQILCVVAGFIPSKTKAHDGGTDNLTIERIDMKMLQGIIYGFFSYSPSVQTKKYVMNVVVIVRLRNKE